jgi:DNA-binding transcriptional ArsR family regulator
MAPPRSLLLTDPVAMRALAHPTRLRLLRLIRERGPITGSELAPLVGESTASISYHLSTLAKHGFIELDPTPGPTKRHKLWRAAFETLSTVSDTTDAPILETVEGAFLAAVLTETRSQQDAYVSHAHELDPQWRDVGLFSHAGLALLPNEVEELGAELRAVLDRWRDERGAQAMHEGAGWVSVSVVAVPMVEGAMP